MKMRLTSIAAPAGDTLAAQEPRDAVGTKLYRSMKVGPGGRPACGATSRKLGVRVPPLPKDVPPDVVPDAEGIVQPRTGGMSAFKVIKDMPIARLPVEHGGTDDSVMLFALDADEVGDDLVYVPDHGSHGTVQPRREVHITAFQGQLCATAATWRPA